MYKVQKIPMYNVCVADVIVRIDGISYNSGRIVVERDTFEFAGHLADDFILGYYKDGCYSIDYLFNSHGEVFSDKTGLYLIKTKLEYDVEDVKRDLTGKVFNVKKNGWSLAFMKFDYGDRSLIDREVQRNRDLIEIDV